MRDLNELQRFEDQGFMRKMNAADIAPSLFGFLTLDFATRTRVRPQWSFPAIESILQLAPGCQPAGLMLS